MQHQDTGTTDTVTQHRRELDKVVADVMAARTRNARHAELLALAHEFMLAFAGLPDAYKVEVQAQPFDPDTMAEIEVRIKSKGVGLVATWAATLGTPVVIVDHQSYVEACTWTEIHGHRVKIVGRHLTHSEAWGLLRPLSLELTRDGVEVEPGRLLSQPSTEDGDSK